MEWERVGSRCVGKASASLYPRRRAAVVDDTGARTLLRGARARRLVGVASSRASGWAATARMAAFWGRRDSSRSSSREGDGRDGDRTAQTGGRIYACRRETACRDWWQAADRLLALLLSRSLFAAIPSLNDLQARASTSAPCNERRISALREAAPARPSAPEYPIDYTSHPRLGRPFAASLFPSGPRWSRFIQHPSEGEGEGDGDGLPARGSVPSTTSAAPVAAPPCRHAHHMMHSSPPIITPSPQHSHIAACAQEP